MSQYLVLSHIEVQNANSIAGLTWGFPAITGFLGFTHALNRIVSHQFDGDYDCELSGCAVISHTYQNKVYQPKKNSDYEFLQSKNPPVLEKHKNSSPPIIEEGRMNLTVSLIVELKIPLALTVELIEKFEKKVLAYCYKQRLAGGTIIAIKKAKLVSANTQQQHVDMLRKIKRLTMPGFVLLDRSSHLQKHYHGLLQQHGEKETDPPQLLDAWLDFCALKSKAIPKLADGQIEPNEKTPADWQYLPKPKPGYLVPLMTGYKAISDVYAAGEVANTRDEKAPTCFVEAIHSVGEWKGIHSLDSIEQVIWRYENDGQWYLCKQSQSQSIGEVENFLPQDSNEELFQTLNFNDALNVF